MNIVPNIILFLTSSFYFLLVLTIFPFIVLFLVEIIQGIVYGLFHFNILPILDIIAIPGKYLRSGIITLYLNLIGYVTNHALDWNDNSITSFKRSSIFRIVLFRDESEQENDPLSFKHYILLLFACYSVELIIIFYIIYSDYIIYLISWPFQRQAIFIYFILLVSLVIGGIPPPEDTFIWLKASIGFNPHIAFSIILFIFASANLAVLFGPQIGLIFFSFFLIIILSINTYYNTKIKQATKNNYDILASQDLSNEEAILTDLV